MPDLCRCLIFRGHASCKDWQATKYRLVLENSGCTAQAALHGELITFIDKYFKDLKITYDIRRSKNEYYMNIFLHDYY